MDRGRGGAVRDGGGRPHEADRKGGHIARRRSDGGLLLREIAQTPEDDLDAFQDTARHRYFNTNTIWFDLQASPPSSSAAGACWACR